MATVRKIVGGSGLVVTSLYFVGFRWGVIMVSGSTTPAPIVCMAGLVDIVAARATKPLVGNAAGELVWMRQPAGSAPLQSAPWQEEVRGHSLARLLSVTAYTATLCTVHIHQRRSFTTPPCPRTSFSS
jgi:hypothetical protein